MLLCIINKKGRKQRKEKTEGENRKQIAKGQI